MWGPAGQERPGLVIFQAGQEMRLDFPVIQESRSNREKEPDAPLERLC